MWNGFLEEYIAFSYFPVNHISTEDNEEKSDSDSEEEDEGFIVRHLPLPKLGLKAWKLTKIGMEGKVSFLCAPSIIRSCRTASPMVRKIGIQSKTDN